MSDKQPAILIMTVGDATPDIREDIEVTLAAPLRDSGFEISIAPPDSTGLTTIRSKRPALVIVVGPSPATLITQLRGLVTNILILAVVPDTEMIVAAAVAAGADDILTQPFYPVLLQKRVKILLRDLLDSNYEVDSSERRSIFDGANDAIFIEDLQYGTFLDVNRRAALWLGYTREQLLQMRFRDIRAPDQKADSDEVRKDLSTRGQLIFEDAYMTRTGEVLPVEVSSRVVQFKGKRAIASFARDISERQAMQAAEREQRQLAEALAGAAAALTSSLNMNEVIEQILQHVKRVVSTDAANIMLIDAGRARVVGHQGYKGRTNRGGLLPTYELTGSWTVGHIVDTGEAVILPDVRDFPDVWTPTPDAEWICSYIGVPIKVEDEVIGFLNLDHSRPGYFNSEHLEKLTAFTNLASSAMRNALLHNALQKEAVQLDARVKERTEELLNSNSELMQEISEREKAEAKLADERNLLRTLIDNLPDHIYVKDLDGRFVLLNATAIDALRTAQADDMVGMTDFDIFAGSEFVNAVYEQEQALMRGDVGMQVTVERGLHPDTPDVWLLVTKVALTDRDGNIVGLVGINRDITPLKEAELTLKRSNAELERRVIARTAELEKLAEIERGQRRMAEALRDSITAVTESLTLDTVLDRILTQVARVVPPHDVAGILLLRQERNVEAIRVRIYTRDGILTDRSNQIYPLDDVPGIRQVIDTGKPLLASTDTTDDAPLMAVHTKGRIELHSFVLLPITVGGKTIGFLRLGSKHPKRFTERDIAYLQPFTYQAGVAIQNAQLFEQVRNNAEHLRNEVEQRTAELNQERSLLRAILDAMTEGVIFVDGNFKPRFANNGFASITGYAITEIDSQDIFFKALGLDSPTLQLIEQTITRARSSMGEWRGELHLRHKSGHEYDATMTVTAIGETGDTSNGMVMVIRNISEEKRLALQKAQFIANASHELRTPITNLKTRLYLISRQPDRLNDHLLIMERVTGRMGKLVDDLLEASRFERGKINLERTLVEAQRIATNVIQTQQAEAEAREINITTAFAKEPLYINADAGRIVQVLTNLIVNAIKYIDEGGTITVRVVASHDQHTIEYHVEDNGPGIPEEIRETIFMPFVRGTEDQSGSGLGLNIAREIVELHGGSIDFASVEGEGVIFTVTLPRADEQQSE